MIDPHPTRREPQTGREIDDVKPGAPPRPATEPGGAEGTSSTGKTKTDPMTGEPQPDGGGESKTS